MGMYFWWQFGMVLELKKLYNLENVKWAGASSGSILCAVATSEVDPVKAHDLAFDLSTAMGCFTSPRGLMGVWGGLVETWLNELLPSDAHIRAKDVTILITKMRGLITMEAEAVRDFESKADLIETILSSAHIPWFMDGNFFHQHRGGRAIDGGFMVEMPYLASYAERLAPGTPLSQIVELQYLKDEIFCAEAKTNWWFRLAPRGALDMIRLGGEFAHRESAKGHLGHLSALESRRRPIAATTDAEVMAPMAPSRGAPTPIAPSGGAPMIV